MIPWDKLDADQKRAVRELVAHYEANAELFRRFLSQIQNVVVENDALRTYTHSTKGRLKDPVHLRNKLARKWLEWAEEEGPPFLITKETLFTRINDLVGFRLLHLHTRQILKMHPLILHAFDEAQLELVEAPFARTWDDESRELYGGVGLKTQVSPKMYSSVHYVVRSNSRTSVTAELQVRTLAEELWGEVDHSINYPEESGIPACVEQIRVLARAASTCTRLVDSIFDAHEKGRRRRPRGAKAEAAPDAAKAESMADPDQND